MRSYQTPYWLQRGKNRIIVLLFCSLLWACSGNDESDAASSAVNESPSAETSITAASNAVAIFDLDGDGLKDKAVILRNALPPTGAKPIPFEGEVADNTGKSDRISISFGNDTRADSPYPFVEQLYPLYEGGEYPADSVLCWPVSAKQALLATSEEGSMIFYYKDNQLIGEACGS